MEPKIRTTATVKAILMPGSPSTQSNRVKTATPVRLRLEPSGEYETSILTKPGLLKYPRPKQVLHPGLPVLREGKSQPETDEHAAGQPAQGVREALPGPEPAS